MADNLQTFAMANIFCRSVENGYGMPAATVSDVAKWVFGFVEAEGGPVGVFIARLNLVAKRLGALDGR